MIFFVKPAAKPFSHGHFLIGPRRLSCALGQHRLTALKFEGDGATPIGTWALHYVMYRPDRERRPETLLPIRAIRPKDGWCDTPDDPNYNRKVVLPYPARAERLWREDALYDIVVVLSHNVRPRIRNGGSAIFMHVAKPGYLPTEGCIALRKPHLRYLLKHSKPGSIVKVLAN
ncbi:MAG: L,D-transpeptidase family protein [Pseudomonadota bacterium]